MPRQPRIDIEGVLQHVMIRGIERRDIFLDDRDRSAFLTRLSQLLVKTNTDCLAWSILSNHAHLLLRPTKQKLSHMMRRLLTGYAVVFNLRHHRNGHLFQNRYKSIVCEEDSYLLELVRYIHLNPLRAGLVPSLRKLDAYRWCGHAGIMGHPILPGQDVDEVLLMFHENMKVARSRYRDFVADGIALGKRDELVGGGLKRHLKFAGVQEFEAYDERVLGSGEFVEYLWHETEPRPAADLPLPSLEVIIGRVAALFGVESSALGQGGRRKVLADAKAAVSFIAITSFGYSSVLVGKNLGISKSGAALAARRGEALFCAMPSLREAFDDLVRPSPLRQSAPLLLPTAGN